METLNQIQIKNILVVNEGRALLNVHLGRENIE